LQHCFTKELWQFGKIVIVIVIVIVAIDDGRQ
jgi:hypothetical protein